MITPTDEQRRDAQHREVVRGQLREAVFKALDNARQNGDVEPDDVDAELEAADLMRLDADVEALIDIRRDLEDEVPEMVSAWAIAHASQAITRPAASELKQAHVDGTVAAVRGASRASWPYRDDPERTSAWLAGYDAVVENNKKAVAPGLLIAVTTTGEMMAVAHVSDLAHIPVGRLAALCLTGEAASMARTDVLTGKPVLAALRDAALPTHYQLMRATKEGSR